MFQARQLIMELINRRLIVFTEFYAIIHFERTWLVARRLHVAIQPLRYFARLQSYFLLIMFVSNPPRRITQIISADLKIAVTLVVINIF